MAQPDIDIDEYKALAELLVTMPHISKKILRFGVVVMADGGKRNATGAALLLVVGILAIGSALFFRVPPIPFVMILLAGAILAAVAWAVYRKIL